MGGLYVIGGMPLKGDHRGPPPSSFSHLPPGEQFCSVMNSHHDALPQSQSNKANQS
jgi:hypothetical protein